METKEELRAKLREAEENELNEIQEREYPKFKELIGKCFKLRNSYSCPESAKDYWDVYSKVIEIKKSYLYTGGSDNKTVLSCCKVIQFQTTKNGSIMIEPYYRTYVHSLGKEISAKVFSREFDKVIDKISKLRG